MRHLFYVAFTLAVVARSTQARADIFTYNMTGTITSPTAVPNFLPGFAVGDHISWTEQYDSSASLSGSGPGWNQYAMSGAVLTNVVDQTTGTHFPSPSPPMVSQIQLGNSGPSYTHNLSSNNILIQDFTDVSKPHGVVGLAALSLAIRGSLPTLNLSEFQLNKLAVVEGNQNYSQFEYCYNSQGFVASVDSISGVTRAAPEPGSLTLFLLGAAGLAARGLRRRRQAALNEA